MEVVLNTELWLSSREKRIQINLIFQAHLDLFGYCDQFSQFVRRNFPPEEILFFFKTVLLMFALISAVDEVHFE